mmetsp:Transcript_149209/g.278214  ORF Transcript_149209/g.278214 Transcript_149209/m.278214 type:complete len:234 (-) Transcript_149209:288-989(-)
MLGQLQSVAAHVILCSTTTRSLRHRLRRCRLSSAPLGLRAHGDSGGGSCRVCSPRAGCLCCAGQAAHSRDAVSCEAGECGYPLGMRYACSRGRLSAGGRSGIWWEAHAGTRNARVVAPPWRRCICIGWRRCLRSNVACHTATVDATAAKSSKKRHAITIRGSSPTQQASSSTTLLKQLSQAKPWHVIRLLHNCWEQQARFAGGACTTQTSCEAKARRTHNAWRACFGGSVKGG